MSAPPSDEYQMARERAPSVDRVLRIAMLAIFATTLFVRAVDPVIVQIADDFAVDPATVALLATAFALPYAITQPVLGAFADMFGKMRMMTVSLVVLAIAALIGAAASSFPILFASRVLAGIVAGGIFPVAVAIASDLVPLDNRQVAIGRLLAAAMLGSLLGSPGAGAVGDLIGWRGVFVAMAVLSAAALAAAIVGFRDIGAAGPARVDLASLPSTYSTIFRNPLAKICYSAVLIEAIFLFGLFPYVAALLQAGGESRASIAGIVIAGFGLGGIIYSSTVSLLLSRLGERRLMISGGCVMGFALMAVALRLPWLVEALEFVLLGLGFYMLHGVIQIYASELAPAARGSAMALHSSFFFFGHALGPVVYGFGLAYAGLAPMVVIGGLALIGAGLMCASRLRRGQPAELR